MNDLFYKHYYNQNQQDKDRIGLLFYKNILKKNLNVKFVLDFGCGLGFFLMKIEKLKFIKNIYGYEISKYALERSKKNTTRTTVVDDLDQINKNNIDLVTFLHVLEHIEDHQIIEIFKNLRKITSNDVKFLVSTPAKNGLAHKLKKKNWIGFKDKTHINLKSQDEWEFFFNKLQFKVLSANSDGLWNFPYQNMLSFKFIKIIFLMIYQIFTGNLCIKPSEGETLIFILKKND